LSAYLVCQTILSAYLVCQTILSAFIVSLRVEQFAKQFVRTKCAPAARAQPRMPIAANTYSRARLAVHTRPRTPRHARKHQPLRSTPSPRKGLGGPASAPFWLASPPRLSQAPLHCPLAHPRPVRSLACASASLTVAPVPCHRIGVSHSVRAQQVRAGNKRGAGAGLVASACVRCAPARAGRQLLG
jgi:hypothetical protein